jgi:hypothetical protein
MKLGIMQAYFFPYIGYFQLIEAVDKFIIYENVSFRKRSWITRNRLLNKSCETPYFINVPVHGSSSNKRIKDIEINYSSDWTTKLTKGIYHDYKHALHFDTIYPLLKDWLSVKHKSLHDFNSQLIISICSLLSINTQIVYKNSEHLLLEDKLSSLADISGVTIKAQRIIELCKVEQAEIYVNPIGGREMYDKSEFKSKGIDIYFTQQNEPLPYPQFSNEFIPYLSIIDELMHSGIEGTKKSLKNYSLV